MTLSMAPKITGTVVSKVNARLHGSEDATPILSDSGFKVSLRMDEDGFFGGRGAVVLRSMAPAMEFSLPLSLSYGFLNLKAEVDLQELVDRIFVRRGIIRNDARARAELSLKLLPFNYTARLQGDGEYVHAPAIKPHVALRLHHSTFGTESAEVIGQRLMTPVGFITSLHGVSLSDEGQSPSSLTIKASGLDLHGSSVDELRSIEAVLKTSSRSHDADVAVSADVRAETAYGNGTAELELGNFSAGDFAQGRMSLSKLVFSPFSMVRHFTGDEAYLELKDLTFDADFEADGADTTYDIKGRGRLTHRTGSLSIRDFNGGFDFNITNVNEGGERVIDAIGREIFIRDGAGYKTSIAIENGRLSYNGN